MTSRDPQLLSSALAELIALRGLARTRAASDLEEAWSHVAGDQWALATRPLKISRGVLHVEVKSAALLGQLVAFHRVELTSRFQQQVPHLNVKSIKFKLAGM